jgi:hypothetical protein
LQFCCSIFIACRYSSVLLLQVIGVAFYWHKWMTNVLQFIFRMIGRLQVFCSSLIGLLQRKTMVNGAQQEYLFCFRTYPCFIIVIHF